MPARALRSAPVGDTDAFRPTRQRPVRVRARSMAADTHFEPHSHAWSQLAYCASGIVQTITVTAQRSLSPYLVQAASLGRGSAVVRLR